MKVDRRIGDALILARSLLSIPLGVVLLSQSMAATASSKSLLITQQPATASPNTQSPEQQQAYTRGQQLLQQAQKLSEQGTGEARQQAIARGKPKPFTIQRRLSAIGAI